jgi:hypothetical protein
VVHRAVASCPVVVLVATAVVSVRMVVVEAVAGSVFSVTFVVRT